MDTLAAARAQMAISLGFHMIFAGFGIGLPLLMVIAEGLYLKTGRRHYRDLAYKWAKATGLLFAVGAVSGTALSFELGLLWPEFMRFAGAIVGPAFALEGFAFFIEAIFLGLYLYGWDRLSPRAHWLCGVPVAVSGMLSGVVVVAVNSWMQVPGGYTKGPDGMPAEIHPLAVFLSPHWLHMAIHSTLACYIAVGFAVAGVYAVGMLRGRRDEYHRAGLRLGLVPGTVCAILMPLSGDINSRIVAIWQPAKLAAMEALFRTQKGAPLVFGGLPDPEAGVVRYGIEIPKGLSLLVAFDADAEVAGLDRYPEVLPYVVWVHLAFQVMVLGGLVLLAVGSWAWWASRGGRQIQSRAVLWALAAASPLGFIALEAGWLVTELGRQPWTIYGEMLTRDAVTPVQEVTASLIIFTAIYAVLLGVVAVLLWRLATGGPRFAHARQGKGKGADHDA